MTFIAPTTGQFNNPVRIDTMRTVLLALAMLFTGASSTVFFEDRFDANMDKWTVSNWKAGDMGTWTYTSGEWFGDEATAKGIATTDDLKHHAISAKLDKPASTTGSKPLVVQFTVKHEKYDYSFCGGGYVKLLSFILHLVLQEILARRSGTAVSTSSPARVRSPWSCSGSIPPRSWSPSAAGVSPLE